MDDNRLAIGLLGCVFVVFLVVVLSANVSAGLRPCNLDSECDFPDTCQYYAGVGFACGAGDMTINNECEFDSDCGTETIDFSCSVTPVVILRIKTPVCTQSSDGNFCEIKDGLSFRHCAFACSEGQCVDSICGDSQVTGNESCELPGTSNNEFCAQSEVRCDGDFTGVRDNFGSCNAECACEQDRFVFSCIKDSCGAGCGSDSDCVSGNDFTAGSCNDWCQCEFECVIDVDGDGVCDNEDMCLDSREGEPVDQMGCDIFQFCSEKGLSCGDDCLMADWRDNEPGVIYPQDCTVALPLNGDVLGQPKCVPTEFTEFCAG